MSMMIAMVMMMMMMVSQVNASADEGDMASKSCDAEADAGGAAPPNGIAILNGIGTFGAARSRRRAPNSEKEIASE